MKIISALVLSLKMDAHRLEKAFNEETDINKKIKIYEDLLTLKRLMELNNFNIKLPRYYMERPYEENHYLPSIFLNHIFDMESTADDVINLYQRINFETFDYKADLLLTIEERDELLKEFFEFFCPQAWDIYQKLKNEGHISYCEDTLEGECFALPTINSYYINIGKADDVRSEYTPDYKNNLHDLLTIIHEVMHVYTYYYASTKTPEEYDNIIDGIYYESVPIYAEMSFMNYLIDKKIATKHILFEQNYNDRIYLECFKTIKYLATLTRKSIEYQIDPSDYSYEVLDPVDIDGFDEEYETGFITDVAFAFGASHAFFLMDEELSGEKPLQNINDYLDMIANQTVDEIDFYNYDLECMEGLLEERMTILNKTLKHNKFVL